MKNHNFPIYLKCETPIFGLQFIKVIADNQQVYLRIDKFMMPDGSIGYDYSCNRKAISKGEREIMETYFTQCEEKEFMEALKNVADFFAKVVDKLN